MKRRAFLFALLGGTLLLPLASDPARANLDESDEKGGNPLRRRRNASKRDRRRRQQINYKGREIVKFKSSEKPGTIIVKTKERALYQIMPGGKAMRYLVAVGKEGFAWSGVARIGLKRKNPTWTPPAEMIERTPKYAKWKNGMPAAFRTTRSASGRSISLTGAVTRCSASTAPTPRPRSALRLHPAASAC